MTTKTPDYENRVSAITSRICRSRQGRQIGTTGRHHPHQWKNSVTRQRAIQAAMLLLGEMVPQPHNDPSSPTREAGDDDHTDLASFFNRDGEMKPADHAYLCAAYYFSQFGGASFSTAQIRAIATEAGVVLPDRLDMTFTAATKKGKKLFQSAGRGAFKPTAAGSVEFRERWGVKPGRQVAPMNRAGGIKDAQAR